MKTASLLILMALASVTQAQDAIDAFYAGVYLGMPMKIASPTTCQAIRRSPITGIGHWVRIVCLPGKGR